MSKSRIRQLNIFLLITLIFSSSLLLFQIAFPRMDTVSASEEDDTCGCTPVPLPSIPIPSWFPRCPTKTPTPQIPVPTPTEIASTPTPTPTTIVVLPTLTPTISSEITSTPIPTPTSGGGGQGGEQGGGNNGGGGGGGQCGNSKPGNTSLQSVTSVNSGKVRLTWTKVSDADHYSLVYGLSSGNYEYGLSDTGNTDNFTVSDLDPGKAYCFAVRPVNGCMPGNLSNEICTGAGPRGGLVLGVSTGEVLGLSATSGSLSPEVSPDNKGYCAFHSCGMHPRANARGILPLRNKPAESSEKIIIPSVNIDLPIQEAPIVNGYWELSQTSASHGIGSAKPGGNGNIVIFAHARPGLFYNLKNVQEGNVINLFYNDHQYHYRVAEIKSVSPDQIETIAPTSGETLTLYTCSGFLDEKRLLVIAKPDW